MTGYIARRLLLFIPTLIAISLLAFLISVNAPGDPVERIVSASPSDAISSQQFSGEEQKRYWRNKLGLNLPLFYFSVTDRSYPPLADVVSDEYASRALVRLSRESGQPEKASEWYKKSIQLTSLVNQAAAPDSLKFLTRQLTYSQTITDAGNNLSRLTGAITKHDNIYSLTFTLIGELKQTANDLKENKKLFPACIPVIRFHSDNQYHRWMFGDGNMLTGNNAGLTRGIIRGDFGISYQTGQPVGEVIGSKIGWSLLLAVLSIFLAYTISVPLGTWAGARSGSALDRNSSMILYLLFSMPAFWIATLLLFLFANPDILHFFPASGIKPATGYPSDGTWLEKVRLTLPYLVLPLICYTYSSFAFLSRTTRNSVVDVMSQDFILTANAKGLSPNRVIFVHALRNSLLPLITVFTSVFPRALGGSVILETIFSIPGMGFEIYQAVHNQNYPMIVAVFTLSGLLTVTGYVLADILYALADPRISFQTRNTR
jgi:peptide/nickel transport system permease protein